MEARRYLRYLWLALIFAPLPASGETVRIYVTNAAGDSVHVIDPASERWQPTRTRTASRFDQDHVGAQTGQRVPGKLATLIGHIEHPVRREHVQPPIRRSDDPTRRRTTCRSAATVVPPRLAMTTQLVGQPLRDE